MQCPGWRCDLYPSMRCGRLRRCSPDGRVTVVGRSGRVQTLARLVRILRCSGSSSAAAFASAGGRSEWSHGFRLLLSSEAANRSPRREARLQRRCRHWPSSFGNAAAMRPRGCWSAIAAVEPVAGLRHRTGSGCSGEGRSWQELRSASIAWMMLETRSLRRTSFLWGAPRLLDERFCFLEPSHAYVAMPCRR